MDNISLFLQLIIIFSIPLAIIFLLTSFLKTECGKKTSYAHTQALIGIIFGVIASLSTYFSVSIGDEVISIRNAIVLSTGFIFGLPAGIIAGIIGAVYRFFAVLYVEGLHTEVASAIATLVAGGCGGLLRVYLFDNKSPKSLHGFFIAINIEILHILLIILTSIKDIHAAFVGIKLYSMPMFAINGIFTALALAVASWKTSNKLKKKIKLKSITQSFEQWLAICLIVGLGLSTSFIWSLQTRISTSDTANLLSINLNDVRQDIIDLQNIALEDTMFRMALGLITNNYIGEDGGVIIADSQGIILSDRFENKGQTLLSLGLNLQEEKEDTLFLATVHDSLYECMYLEFDELYIVAIIPTEDAQFSRNMFVYLNASLQVLVLAIMFLLIYILVKRLVIDNIRKMNHSLAEITSGNLNTLIDIRTNEEFSKLSDDINATVSSLKDHIEAEKTRLDAELEFARTIQSSSLPNIFPPYPNHDEFEIFACMHTAKEVGGDFYDFYFTDDEHLAFLVADVSGKGIPAAIFMMKAKTLIKSFAEAGHTVDEIFSLTNNHLCENNDASMFVTAWLGILNIKTGLLYYANAGHNPPLLKNANGNYEYFKSKANLVLALMEDAPYQSHELQLKQGDEIFLYTDGITEAVDINNQLYGEVRLKEFLQKSSSCTKEICTAVLDDVNNFAGEATQADDITMLSLKFQKNTAKHEINIDAEIANIPVATDFVGEHLERYACPPKAQAQINIAMDEILSNIVRYGNLPPKAQINIQVEIAENPRAVILRFCDGGVPFNPLLSKSPTVNAPLEMREVGGLGIHLLKQMMDDVSYEYKDSQNIFCIKKIL